MHPRKNLTNLMRSFAGLLPLLLLFLMMSCANIAPAASEQIQMMLPMVRRSEGRVTLEYIKNEETLRYQLAFSEVVDSFTMRSKISIGYISYDPKVYHYRQGQILTLDDRGNCVSLKDKGSNFVPELSWFLKLTYTDDELEKLENQYQIGPSGVISLMPKNVVYSHSEVHRNIKTLVTSTIHNRKKASNILYEILVPDLKIVGDTSMSFFSVRETIKNAQADNGDTLSTSLIIDYFYTESIDKKQLHQLDWLERELSLPLAAGCSSFLNPIEPKTAVESFLMIYSQNSRQSTNRLAYDHESNLLRHELVGKSVAVWDLSEDLVYHVDSAMMGKTTNEAGNEVHLKMCSVISVEGGDNNASGEQDPNSQRSDNAIGVPTMLKPYKQTGSSIEVLEFLGARQLYYMGQAALRELPCWVFETIVDEPPRVFEIDLRVERTYHTDEQSFEYIVQFHIFRTGRGAGDTEGGLQAPAQSIEYYSSGTPMIGDQFWPARISLFRRHMKSGRTQLYDQLDISYFHFDLYGWTMKPSELFMLPQCFNDDDMQLRVNLYLEFEQQNLSEEQHRQLRHNKYKLERDLITDLFDKLLQMSRLHLTGFDLSLKPHQILAKFIISDRAEDKRVSYFGEGNLPNPESYINNRVRLDTVEESAAAGESACLMEASHVAEVSMVIYCPRPSETQESTCTAIFGESQPVIKQSASSKQNEGDPFSPSLACQVYRFEARESPKSATNDVEKIKSRLFEHKFEFITAGGSQNSPTPAARFSSVVRDFEVSHELQLITISNYKYATTSKAAEADTNNPDAHPTHSMKPVERAQVRTFDTLDYESFGDCLRLCNLDVDCKSFSYCTDKSLSSSAGRCVLSSLDLRQNNIEKQLVSAKLTENKQIVVHDLEQTGAATTDGSQYVLDLKSGCNIYERDFLSMFTRTDEILRIQPDLAKHYLSTPNANECARWTSSLESTVANHHSAMFAYCPSTGTCLVDENLFLYPKIAPRSSRSAAEAEDSNADSKGSSVEANELACEMFRRRYQNYFHIRTKVLKRQPTPQSSSSSNLIKQMDFQFNTVEECARSCWNLFGHTCLSFDFCSAQGCILNLINLDSGHSIGKSQLSRAMEWEARSGCLHYERDLKWDELRLEHLIGHHTTLHSIAASSNQQSNGGVTKTFMLLMLASILFVIGLAVGRTFNNRLDGVASMIRRSVPGSNRQPSETSTQSRAGVDSQPRSPGSTRFNFENEIYEGSHAIKMEELGQK